MNTGYSTPFGYVSLGNSTTRNLAGSTVSDSTRAIQSVQVTTDNQFLQYSAVSAKPGYEEPVLPESTPTIISNYEPTRCIRRQRERRCDRQKPRKMGVLKSAVLEVT